jgi:hypothetical protein
MQIALKSRIYWGGHFEAVDVLSKGSFEIVSNSGDLRVSVCIEER